MLHFLPLALLLACLPLPAWASGNPGELRQRLEAVRQELQTLRDQLARSEGEAGRLGESLRQAEERIAEQGARLRRTTAAIAGRQARLQELEEQRRQQAGRLDHERDLLAESLRAAWRAGRQDRLRLLLNQQNPAAIGRVLAFGEYIGAARVERIRAIEAATAALALTERQINESIAGLDAARARQEEEMAALETGRLERQRTLAALRDEIARGQGDAASLENDGKHLESLLRSLERSLADIPAVTPGGGPFAARRGQMPWPTAGTIRTGFGTARAGGGLTWRGVLIATPANRPVRAIHHGRVVFADRMRGFGLLVILDHGDGYMSLYGHLADSERSVGEWLQGGDIVGLTGNSGGQEEDGLYFEVRHQGKPQDPAVWCAGRTPPRG